MQTCQFETRLALVLPFNGLDVKKRFLTSEKITDSRKEESALPLQKTGAEKLRVSNN